tara:strand:+ start:66 stop:971 length:906 start_codon:yes stop_codon:yes gene_type:complete
MKNINNFLKKFGGSLKKKVNLSSYSWFNLGGEAEFFFKPKDKNQLLEFFKEIKNYNLKTTFLGAGSNTLFRDGGVKGVVIKLGKSFSYVNLLSDNVIEAGAATLDRQVADFAKGNSLSNFEFLSCIPGSIGGAIIMNTGCYDNDISKILISVKAIDKNSCKEIEINKKDIKFIYRGNNLSKDLIIISAKFKGVKKKRELINQKQIEYTNKKKQAQPSQIKTCGSTFKNISEDKKAWKLIKKAGCEDLTEGQAAISKKHCNFFVNKGNAKSSDIEKLIQKVKKQVYEKTKINLELEIKIIGD